MMHLKRETMHLAINFLDRYLASEDPPENIDSLKLVCLACLFVAAKSEELKVPITGDAGPSDNFSHSLHEISPSFRKHDLFIVEAKLVAVLEWFLLPTSVWSWIKIFIFKTINLVISSPSFSISTLIYSLSRLMNCCNQNPTVYTRIFLVFSRVFC